ncbi:MAG: hypothetical protein A2687_02900 [Candidatus Levybacteria bacterium RIFCSPHIGHO2_01_FULL_38_26]|nr:MAG: hypothetical protein A2687_02900 [Candidatus Levybacteria bacterium RIFCSPHIGHO2_01_FULL_38_26]
MNENENRSNELIRKQNHVNQFLESGIEGNINRFPISGRFDPNLGKAIPKLYVAYFSNPNQPSRSDLLEFSNDPRLNLNLYRRKIFGLVVPPRIQDWEEDNPRLKRAVERKASSEGFPSEVLVFARQPGSRKELVVLCSIIKVSPQTGLSEIQNALRLKLRRQAV